MLVGVGSKLMLKAKSIDPCVLGKCRSSLLAQGRGVLRLLLWGLSFSIFRVRASGSGFKVQGLRLGFRGSRRKFER